MGAWPLLNGSQLLDCFLLFLYLFFAVFSRLYISCDVCSQFFHTEYIGLTDTDLDVVLKKPYFFCPDCLDNEQVPCEDSDDMSVSFYNTSFLNTKYGVYHWKVNSLKHHLFHSEDEELLKPTFASESKKSEVLESSKEQVCLPVRLWYGYIFLVQAIRILSLLLSTVSHW